MPTPPARTSRRVVMKVFDRYVGDAPDARTIEGIMARLWTITAESVASPVHIEPVFSAVTPDVLQRLVARARERDPAFAREQINPFAWFRVTMADPAQADSVAHTMATAREGVRASRDATVDATTRPGLFSGDPMVETAWVEPDLAPQPTDHPWDAGDFSSDEGWLGTDGIRAIGLTAAGATGAGVTFADVENAWWLDASDHLAHPDLAGPPVSVFRSASTAFPPLELPHGTQSLGCVFAARQSPTNVGAVGVTPDVAAVKLFGNIASSGGFVDDTPNALALAAANLAAGDVLLLEAQTSYDHYVSGVFAGRRYVPIEARYDVYIAVRLLTALGVSVVAAAGNGNQFDLDDVNWPSEGTIFKRGSAAFRDSGAVIVASAVYNSGWRKSPTTNFGSRIDCFAWGSGITTTSVRLSIAGAPTDALVVDTFSDTSGASAIVAGAAVATQGMARANPVGSLEPTQLRWMLTQGGTTAADPGLGVMPNLSAIQTTLVAVADVYLRDDVTDDGSPHVGTGGSSHSPDIIVRHAAVASPQTLWGEGSPGEDDAELSEDVVPGHPHVMYARVRNRASASAGEVKVALYWSEASSLVMGPSWHHIGDAVVPSLPGGDILTVSDPVSWTPSVAELPTTGHYCFVAVAGCASDPAPPPSTFAAFSDFVHHVQATNNVAWRNFALATPSGRTRWALGERWLYTLRVKVRGAPKEEVPFAVDLVLDLPLGTSLRVGMSKRLAEVLRVPCTQGPDGVLAELPALVKRWPIGAGRVPAGLDEEVRIELAVPVDARDRRRSYGVAIRQVYGKVEVGRFTWKLGGPRIKLST